MEFPQPEYVGLMAGEDSGGARSPKYPSTVTKVDISHEELNNVCDIVLATSPVSPLEW